MVGRLWGGELLLIVADDNIGIDRMMGMTTVGEKVLEHLRATSQLGEGKGFIFFLVLVLFSDRNVG